MSLLFKVIKIPLLMTLYLWTELFLWLRVMASLSFIADDMSLLVKYRKGQSNLIWQHIPGRSSHWGCEWAARSGCSCWRRPVDCMRDKTDSLGAVEIVRASTENMWIWPSCFLICFLSPLTCFHLPPIVSLNASDACQWFIRLLHQHRHSRLFISLRFWLTSLINPLPFLLFRCLLLTLCLPPPARRAHRYRRHHHKGRRERRKHKRHGHREGGHHGGEQGQGHNHGHFWTKKKNTHTPSPFLSSPAVNCSLPVSLSTTFPQTLLYNLTAKNSLPKPCPAHPSPPAPHCPVLRCP